MKPNQGRAKPLVTNELIVAYDIMWEAANRLRGLYVQEIRDAGDDGPAIRKLWEIRDEVEAVDPDDIVAQRAMTEKLRREYAERRA